MLDLPVTSEQLRRYETGNETIQEVFPNLSDVHREFIMSGIPPEEGEIRFPSNEKGKGK